MQAIRWAATLLAVPTVALIAAQPSFAADTLDQSFTTPTAPSTLAVPSYLRGQTFTAGLDGELTQVVLPWISARGTAGTLTVALWSATSNTPSAPVLASQTLAKGLVPSTLGPMTVVFDTPTAVSAGTGYALVLSNSGDTVDWGYSNSGGYNDGRETYSITSGATWTGGTSRDLYFQTYVDVPAPTPEPEGAPPSPPDDIVQQIPWPDEGGCVGVPSEDWGSGWSRSWAQWPNAGKGGPVCTRTLTYQGDAWVVADQE